VIVVDDWFRRPIGRPWLTIAIDVATRCVVGMYLGMDRPSAATVALLLTRVALPKEAWLANLRVQAVWPMHGIPKVLHLDNAAAFKSKALRAGCSQYGIELMYRPVGRPHFGGHIERLNRTLMERLRGLPGATGSSPKGRKARDSEKQAVMTLRELEAWQALEVAQRYHHSAHRGLMGATPASAWEALTDASTPRRLPGTPDEATRFLIQFLPMARRTIQDDGLTLFYIRYWHPIFVVWRTDRRSVTVRYHPEDLSRVFVSAGKKEFIEVRYADLRRGPISLWEQRAAVRLLRAEGRRDISELHVFKAIEEQRKLVARARSETLRQRRKTTRRPADVADFPPSPAMPQPQVPEIDYSKPAPAYDVEQW
jgi:putative transposase